jgi:glutaredoxin
MITIEIMTKKDCCLCDDAKEVIEQVIADFPVELKITDIESDPRLLERYQEKIPVVIINGEECFVFKVHRTTLRKKLEKLLEND